MLRLLLLGAAAGAAYLAHRRRLSQLERDLRSRMADDFHDGPLQSFAGLRMRLHAASTIAGRDPSQATAELTAAEAFCEEQLATMREHLAGMRGTAPQRIDLAQELELLAARAIHESGLEIHLDRQGGHDVPAPLLAIVKEALHNIHKHARATRAAIRLRESPGAIELIIEDDGQGFPQGVIPASIARRTARLGGTLQVTGSRLTIRVPR